MSLKISEVSARDARSRNDRCQHSFEDRIRRGRLKFGNVDDSGRTQSENVSHNSQTPAGERLSGVMKLHG